MGESIFSNYMGKKARFGEGEKSHIVGEFYFLSIYSNIQWAMGGNNFLIDRGREGGPGGIKNHATKNNAPSK